MGTILAAVLALVLVQDVAADVNVLATALLGLAGTFVLGGAKVIGTRVAGGLAGPDSAITRLIKPIQPVILMGLTYALPKIAAATGVITPDAAALASAPLATIAGVGIRELVRRYLMPKPKPTMIG